jgi:hypothetical protein
MKQMANAENPDLAWMRWADVMRDASSLIGKRDFAAALAAVESFLALEARSDLRSDALGFRADIQERLGDFEAAQEDLLTARSLVGATYARYVHELSLGGICRKQNRVAEAASWFRTALHTCLEGEGISGGTALKELFALYSQEALPTEDQSLCAEVARGSWHLLGLPGQPDLSNLPGVILAIKEGEAQPPRKRTS